jgi:fructose-1,6-bisphosphatase/inositol monophosphatase family enzyme
MLLSPAGKATALITASSIAILAFWTLRRRHDDLRTHRLIRRHQRWLRDCGLSDKWQVEVSVAVALACKCGANMLRGTTTPASLKRDVRESPTLAASIDPQTVVDVENERLVMDTLAERFPSHDVIGEETTAFLGRMPEIDPARPTWIVDPIDGTQNFCSGIPLSCVSIGLAVRGKPELGIVYDPHRDELFVGIASEGKAFVNGERLRSCEETGAPASLEAKAVVLTDVGYERSEEGARRIAACHEALLHANVFSVRIIGSTVLALSWLAAGRAHAAYMGVHKKDCPKPWDYCAACAIGEACGVTFASLTRPSASSSTRAVDHHGEERFERAGGAVVERAGGRAEERFERAGGRAEERFELTSASVVAARSAALAAKLKETLRASLAAL